MVDGGDGGRGALATSSRPCFSDSTTSCSSRSPGSRGSAAWLAYSAILARLVFERMPRPDESGEKLTVAPKQFVVMLRRQHHGQGGTRGIFSRCSLWNQVPSPPTTLEFFSGYDAFVRTWTPLSGAQVMVIKAG